MKKYLTMVVAVLLAVAVAVPAFAVEFKYGGLFRARLQSSDNVIDGHDKDNGEFDDNQLYIDQRLRMYFTFVASERLQVVTKWEADTIWGNETPGAGRHGGGDVGADATNLEMKNVYVDFMIPNTPTRATIGVQGIALLSGWIVDDDFSAAVRSTPLDPVTVQLGYIAAQNEDVTDHSENIDDWFINVGYAQGPLKASAIGFYQYGHDVETIKSAALLSDGLGVEDNHLFDLGLSLSYQMDMFGAWVNFVKNFGSFDYVTDLGDTDDEDYEGWMVEAAANFFVQNFTFTVGGFWTSDDFVYPVGVSHYWSEIMGLGTLDTTVGEPGAADQLAPGNKGAYTAADYPTNLWTVTAGVAWQALETTKLTFNYYYLGTDSDVLANAVTGEEDDVLGHELNLYLDQAVVDGLNLRLVGAYLFAEDALTVYEDDDDIYELGARLQWAF